MNKIIFINENDMNKLYEGILTETFVPWSSMVLKVKSYLDKNFKRQVLDDLDNNGYPKKTNMVVMVSNNNQPLRTMTIDELLLLLEDKFRTLISKDSDRKKFLKQVIIDWFNKTISRNGILSVNHL